MSVTRWENWLSELPGAARRVVVGILIFSALLLLVLITSVWSSSFESWSEIEKNEPHIARLRGYQLFQPSMLEAASEAKVLLSELAFAAVADKSQTGAQLQQLLRRFAEEAGLIVRGSQLLPAAQQAATPEGFVQITVELQMRGLPLALNLFLRDVYEHSPRLKVTELNVMKVRDRRSSRRSNQTESLEVQELDLSVQVAALMVDL
jgi:hypothetical protein